MTPTAHMSCAGVTSIIWPSTCADTTSGAAYASVPRAGRSEPMRSTIPCRRKCASDLRRQHHARQSSMLHLRTTELREQKFGRLAAGSVLVPLHARAAQCCNRCGEKAVRTMSSSRHCDDWGNSNTFSGFKSLHTIKVSDFESFR